MARVGVMIDEKIKVDAEIMASITGDTLYGLLDKAIEQYLGNQDPKIKAAIEAARVARG